MAPEVVRAQSPPVHHAQACWLVTGAQAELSRLARQHALLLSLYWVHSELDCPQLQQVGETQRLQRIIARNAGDDSWQLLARLMFQCYA